MWCLLLSIAQNHLWVDVKVLEGGNAQGVLTKVFFARCANRVMRSKRNASHFGIAAHKLEVRRWEVGELEGSIQITVVSAIGWKQVLSAFIKIFGVVTRAAKRLPSPAICCSIKSTRGEEEEEEKEEEEEERTSKTFERSASMAGVEPGASRLSFSLDNHSWSTVWSSPRVATTPTYLAPSMWGGKAGDGNDWPSAYHLHVSRQPRRACNLAPRSSLGASTDLRSSAHDLAPKSG